MEETYSQRALKALNPVARKLLHLMDEKKTNLSVSADVTKASQLLQIAEELGPKIAL